LGGTEKALAGRVAFIYLDISDPRTKGAQVTLKFRTPPFLILDAKGGVLAERSSIIAPADFERWVTDTIRERVCGPHSVMPTWNVA
jgi:hypothetical protein